jgi:hypothetical protein
VTLIIQRIAVRSFLSSQEAISIPRRKGNDDESGNASVAWGDLLPRKRKELQGRESLLGISNRYAASTFVLKASY